MQGKSSTATGCPKYKLGPPKILWPSWDDPRMARHRAPPESQTLSILRYYDHSGMVPAWPGTRLP